MHSEILKPVMVLAGWTMIVWMWMYATRLPAFSKAKIDATKMVGSIGSDLDKVLPTKVQWVAHNYNHLHEQPTIFYAVAISLAFMGAGNTLNAWIAWAYVGLRIAHSVFQALINQVAIRFVIFLLSGLCLAALTLHAIVIAFAT
jgi:hypothetical protein